MRRYLNALTVRAIPIAFVLAVSTSSTQSAEPLDKVDFNRDIRPILRQNCTGCHGGVKSAGGISFVNPEAAYAEGDSGTRAIVPNNVPESEMVKRFSSQDPDERMPPPDHGSALKPEEQNKIRKWIEQGAHWEQLWSLRPVAPVALPNPKFPSTLELAEANRWLKQPIDRFLIEKMLEHHLRPSQEASANEWLRRVSLDLTGIPPTIEEFASFIQDRTANIDKAKENVVERLLQSDRFGERPPLDAFAATRILMIQSIIKSSIGS